MADESDSDVQIIEEDDESHPKRRRKRNRNDADDTQNRNGSSRKRRRLKEEITTNQVNQRDHSIDSDNNTVTTTPTTTFIDNVYAESMDDSTSISLAGSCDEDISSTSWDPLPIEPERRAGVEAAMRALSERILDEYCCESIDYHRGCEYPYDPYHDNDSCDVNTINGSSIKSEQEQELINLKKTMQDLQDRLHGQTAKVKKLEKRNRNLLLRMKGLKEKVIEGRDPLFDRVKMHNENGSKNLKYSEKCYQLRKQVMQQYDEGQIVLQVVDPGHSHSQSPRERSMLKRVISEYLRENVTTNAYGLDISTPRLSVGGSILDFDRVLEEFVISKPHRIPVLVGQKGLRTKRDIPVNTCIGQYVGITYLKEEFEVIYDGSSQRHLRNTYAFDQVVNVVEDGNSASDDVIDETVDLVLDGYAMIPMVKESGHLMRINDCRLDIHQPQPSEDDREFENLRIVQCTVNKWPAVFMVTSKDVGAGDELFGWFGEDFRDAIKSLDQNMRLRHEMRMCMDDSELKEEKDALVNDYHEISDSE